MLLLYFGMAFPAGIPDSAPVTDAAPAVDERYLDGTGTQPVGNAVAEPVPTGVGVGAVAPVVAAAGLGVAGIVAPHTLRVVLAADIVSADQVLDASYFVG